MVKWNIIIIFVAKLTSWSVTIWQMVHVTGMSQGRVIDIIIIGGSYSLQYYSFWKGTRIIGSSDHRIVYVKPWAESNFPIKWAKNQARLKFSDREESQRS